MNSWNDSVDNIICKSLTDLGVEISDKSLVSKKVEYVLRRRQSWISVSYTVDKAYDFTVFDLDGDRIAYNHTEFDIEPSDIRTLISKDIACMDERKLKE